MEFTGARNEMKKQNGVKKQSGFTLLELLIALGVGSIISAAIYAVYDNQQKTFLASDQIAAMQQNLRAAMLVMGKEIREAGCDPDKTANAGFVSATIGRMQFTRDIAGDAVKPNEHDGDVLDAGENVTFGFSPADDNDADGIADGGGADWSQVADLKRQDNITGSGFQPIAENIAAIEFNYVLSDNTATTAPTATQLSQIRAVQISILVRAKTAGKILNSISYTTASGAVWGPFNDYYRRRFASTTIQCRDMGL
jgi:type IV pilus assembly protein PilW